MAKNWQVHHDNAPAHSSHLIQAFLVKHGIPVIHRPPYSPDMAPCNFWLFPKLKTTLKRSHIESREELIQNAKAEMNTIPKEAFQMCFQQWKDRWSKCVEVQGVYFEGDYFWSRYIHKPWRLVQQDAVDDILLCGDGFFMLEEITSDQGIYISLR